MKRAMIIGGLAGFVLALLGAFWNAPVAWPGALFRASVAALVGGSLARWLVRVTADYLQQARSATRNSRAPAVLAAKPNPAKP